MDATPGEGEQAKGGERQEGRESAISHGREIGAVPLEPRDKPLVLPMRRLRAVYLCKP
ncbi:hypothetical protein [Syntrophomonas wolfei]|uniref:hypothetical protein n=1 Tax=Syntrophomonas wolfei TaxID=863 RepID=UPI000A45A9B0|nr:hypothetical protein [Syntrophomonas wolfei]